MLGGFKLIPPVIQATMHTLCKICTALTTKKQNQVHSCWAQLQYFNLFCNHFSCKSSLHYTLVKGHDASHYLALSLYNFSYTASVHTVLASFPGRFVSKTTYSAGNEANTVHVFIRQLHVHCVKNIHSTTCTCTLQLHSVLIHYSSHYVKPPPPAVYPECVVSAPPPTLRGLPLHACTTAQGHTHRSKH